MLEIINGRSKESNIDLPDFESAVFTDRSKGWIILPQAVKFASDLNTVLQSLREAVVVEMDDNERVYHATRTAAVLLKDVSGKHFVAYDDSPKPEQNIILARAQEGYQSHVTHGKWILSKNDDYVRPILRRADKLDRIVEVSESPQEIVTREGFEFENNRKTKAIFGDLAGLCGAILDKRGYSKAKVYDPPLNVLEAFDLGSHFVEVRYVGLSIDRLKSSYCIVGNYPFFFSGFARGIRGAPDFKKS